MKLFKKLLSLILMLALSLSFFACMPGQESTSDSEQESVSSSEIESESDQESETQAHVFSWDSFKSAKTALNIKSDKYKNFDLSTFDHDAYQAKADKLLASAKANDSLEVFEPLFDEWEEAVHEMLTYISIANTRYYETGSEEDKEVYETLFAYQTQYITWFGDLAKAMSKANKELKDFFFGEEATEEEIQDYIKRNAFDKETEELMNKLEELSNTALENKNAFDNQEITDDEFIDMTLDLFLQYAPLGDRLAKKLNYDTYLDYAYAENYSREYGPDDVNEGFEYTRSYIIPLVKLGCIASSAFMSGNTYNFYYGTFTKAFTYNRNYYGKYLSDFALTMGGSYLEAYNHVFEDGYYCFTNNTSSLGTAYQTHLYGEKDGLLFFSSSYQNISTIVHELGHYIASYTNELSDHYSMDVCETHSTGNEKLFWAYMDTVVSDEAKGKYVDAIHYSCYSYLYNDLATAVVAAFVTEVENYLFANYKTLTKDQLLAGIKEIQSSYKCGVISDTYWCYPLTACPGYYVSYYAGSLNALQFACQAFEDFDTAKENYLNFMAYSFDEDAGEEFVLDDQIAAGKIFNPFTEDANKYIADNIYSYEKKSE